MSTPRPRFRIAAFSAMSLLLVGVGTACSSAESGSPPAELPPPNQLEKSAALIRPAIVSIDLHASGYVIDEQGNVFNNGDPYVLDGSCSGFVVNPDGYIATAGHCVDVGPEGFRDDYIQHAAAEANTNRPSVSVDDFYQFGSMNWTVEGQTKGSPIDLQVLVHLGGDPNSEPLPARVVDYRSLGQGDVALLKVEAHDLPSSQLVTDQDVRIGDQVLSVGYPASTDLVTDQSAEPSNKEGAISSKKTQGSVPVYEISAAVSPGMSGGPTVSTDGRVMGVNSFTIRGESQPFNFIAPASNLAELMKRNGVESTLAPVDQVYRDGLTAFYAGRYTEAITDFDKVASLSPGHVRATEMKTTATQMRDKYGDWGVPKTDREMWYFIGAGIAAAVAVAMATMVILHRRRRRTTAAAATQTTPEPTTGPATAQAPSPFADTTLIMSSPDTGSDPATSDAAAGVATMDPPTTVGYCASCGTKAAPGDRFCRGCGGAL